MGRIILKNAVKRKPGYMYYVDGEGSIGETKMVSGGSKKKSKSTKKKAKK